MTEREIMELREFCKRNAKGLISPANSGLIVALALFEIADALHKLAASKKEADKP